MTGSECHSTDHPGWNLRPGFTCNIPGVSRQCHDFHQVSDLDLPSGMFLDWGGTRTYNTMPQDSGCIYFRATTKHRERERKRERENEQWMQIPLWSGRPCSRRRCPFVPQPERLNSSLKAHKISQQLVKDWIPQDTLTSSHLEWRPLWGPEVFAAHAYSGRSSICQGDFFRTAFCQTISFKSHNFKNDWISFLTNCDLQWIGGYSDGGGGRHLKWR